MVVVVTRDKSGDIEIWNTDQPKNIICIGIHYLSKSYSFIASCFDSPNDYAVSTMFTVENFKQLFGFTPRKGSKTVYELTLNKLEK